MQSKKEKYDYFANKKRTETKFEAGDWIYLKLQPYKQLSVAVKKYMKLAHKFFGTYQIMEKDHGKSGKGCIQIGTTSSESVHPVFHVSLLKKKIGSKYTVTTSMPRMGGELTISSVSSKITAEKDDRAAQHCCDTIQWLIQWSPSIRFRKMLVGRMH